MDSFLESPYLFRLRLRATRQSKESSSCQVLAYMYQGHPARLELQLRKILFVPWEFLLHVLLLEVYQVPHLRGEAFCLLCFLLARPEVTGVRRPRLAAQRSRQGAPDFWTCRTSKSKQIPRGLLQWLTFFSVAFVGISAGFDHVKRCRMVVKSKVRVSARSMCHSCGGGTHHGAPACGYVCLNRRRAAWTPRVRPAQQGVTVTCTSSSQAIACPYRSPVGIAEHLVLAVGRLGAWFKTMGWGGVTMGDEGGSWRVGGGAGRDEADT